MERPRPMGYLKAVTLEPKEGLTFDSERSADSREKIPQ